MSAVLIIVALLGSTAAGSHVTPDGPASGLSLMQRLRGTKASITSVVSPGADAEPMDESVAKQTFAGQRFSDDDESCSAAGITPGVCALEWLAKPVELPPSPKFRHSKAAAECDEKESTDRLQRALIAEIDAGLAGNHTGFDHARLHELEKELQPTFATLPHEAPLADLEGGLGLASARYLLHQHFLRQHSWYVRGLNPAGDGRQPPDRKEALRSSVAGHLLEVMEKRVGTQGLNLKTLAVFVATLEHLIHGDEKQRLKAAWAVHDLNHPDDVTDSAGLRSVLEMFMAHYVFVSQKADSGYVLTLEQGRKEVKAVSRSYEGWERLTSFMKEQIHNQRRLSGTDLSFDNAAKAAARVLDYFREVSGGMCHDMERTFTALPGGDSGRISLAAMRESGDKVRESTEYLRSAHALDESDPSHPQILLPNYMLGISNCDGTTSFYDLCCPNACEGRKEHLEKSLAAAEGSTDAAAVVRETVQKQAWDVSADLLKELDEISQHRGGKAMIHGLRFAHWLHSAFPRECPRPVDSDFAAGDVIPDAKADFQESAKVESLFDW
eukprot:gb/GFBE01004498.1/.p1 GENE.gb/GFBE01004498.1/~~gb/GFBE01004498.1/.p1  ORF type:complete len:554 (+),score=124.19 gb/GFBE01004498.1/:1-1662(+)